MLSTADINDTLDMQHAAGRIQAVFNTLNSRNPAVPSYAPDVVLLQEVTHDSALTLATQLTAKTGYTYKVAVNAADGAGAWVCQTCSPMTSNETAILYNSDTMSIPATSTPAFSRLTYDESEVQVGKQWIWLGAATIQLKKTNSAQLYGVYSLHYRTKEQVFDQNGLTEQWTNFLKKRVHDLYPTAIPIIGGDTNNAAGSFMTAFGTSTATSPGVYDVARPKTGGIDVIASTAPKLFTQYDYDYKNYDVQDPNDIPIPGNGYFDTVNTFLQCNTDYGNGASGGTDALSIDGCHSRFYSDHEFAWAIFGS